MKANSVIILALINSLNRNSPHYCCFIKGIIANIYYSFTWHQHDNKSKSILMFNCERYIFESKNKPICNTIKV